MLRSLLSGSLTMQDAVMEILAVVMIVFLVLPLHEMAHGFVAYKLGALMILFVGFGWAKPVPVNPRNFKNPKAGMAVTALAGPVSNLLAGFAAALLYNVAAIVATNVSLSTGAWELISIFFIYFISINISLAVFNLIPIPPLDGSKILFAFLPDRIVYKAYQNEQVLSIVLIVLIFTGVLTGPLSYLQNILTNWVFHLASLPFAAFW